MFLTTNMPAWRHMEASNNHEHFILLTGRLAYNWEGLYVGGLESSSLQLTEIKINIVYQLTVTERTELLIDGGVWLWGDGEEGADDVSFNFLFEGGMSLPWSVNGTGSPSRAR